MRRQAQFVVALATLLLMLAVAACGGGGGGSSSGSGSGGGGGQGGGSTSGDPPPSATFSQVAISLMSDAVIRDVTYEGLPAHQTNLLIGYTGDVTALAGRTVYAVIVQPEAVYVADSYLTTGREQAVSLNLYGNDEHSLVAGRTTGTLQVHACLDPRCEVQLENSPLSVDYDIKVRPGLSLSTESLEQSSNYGSTPAPRTVTVTPPAGAVWDIGPLAVPPDAEESSWSLVPNWLRRSGNKLVFEPPSGLLPGVYAVDFQLRSVVSDARAPNVPQLLLRQLSVRHTVVATAPYAVEPPSESVTASLRGAQPGTVVPQLISQVGGIFSRRGVRTDAFPPAAAGHPLLADWLAFDRDSQRNSTGHTLTYCDPTDRECLPVGTYRGALLLRHTDRQGVVTDFEFPVALTLRP